MATRLATAGHYNLNAGSTLVGNTLHDLNTVDSRNGDLEGITDRDAPTGDSLENEDDSNSGGDCGPQSYGNSLALQGVDGPDPDHSMTLDNEGPRSPYGMLSINDVIPIESTRARFLQLIIDHFITYHVVPAVESPETNYNSPNSKEKLKKRKSRDVQYEGDPRFLLPLTFVANLYETLIREVNQRLATVEGLHEKTFGVALEAAGGLYRRLVKRYPKAEPEESMQAANCFPGSPNTCRVGNGAFGPTMTFKRREMASALEARTKFPQLVTGEEKRVRFVVVHGLELVERPNLSQEDAEWFKRLTGRHEAAISERDYKYFAARVKHRRAPQNSLSSMPGLPFPSGEPPASLSPTSLRSAPFSSGESGSVQAHSSQHQHQHQGQQQQQHTQHQPHALQHAPHTPHIPPLATRDMESPLMHSGIIVVAPAGPPKFCDECGTAYMRETSKFCSECGTKRLGM